MLRKIIRKIRNLLSRIKWKLLKAWYYAKQFYNVFLSRKDMAQKRDKHIYTLAGVGAPMDVLSECFQMPVEEIEAVCDKMRHNMDTSDAYKQMLPHWGLPEDSPAVCIHPNAWQIGEDYVLKLTYDQDSAEKEVLISQALVRDGFPYDFPRFYPTQDGSLSHDNAMLMNRLHGKSNAMLWLQDNCVEEMRKIGSMLAMFHAAMEKTEFGNILPSSSLIGYKGLLMNFSLLLAPSLRPKIRKNYELLENCNLPMGCTHGDFHPGNLRFDANGNFSGMLDFGNAQRDFFLDDAAYYLLQCSVAATLIDDKEKVRAGIKAFLQGYWGDRFDQCLKEQKAGLMALAELQSAKLIVYYKSEHLPSVNQYILRSAELLHDILAEM